MKIVFLSTFAIILYVFLPLLSHAAPPPTERVAIERDAGFEKRSLKHGLVDGFPQLPIVPDAELVQSYDKTEGERIGYEAVYHSQRSVPEVVQFYEEKLGSRGWTVVDLPSNRAAVEQSISFKKGRRLLVIAVESEGDHTEIVLEVPIHEKHNGGW